MHGPVGATGSLRSTKSAIGTGSDWCTAGIEINSFPSRYYSGLRFTRKLRKTFVRTTTVPASYASRPGRLCLVFGSCSLELLYKSAFSEILWTTAASEMKVFTILGALDANSDGERIYSCVADP